MSRTLLAMQPIDGISKRTNPHRFKKHVEHHRKLEKLRRKELIMSKIGSWIEPSSRLSNTLVKDYFHCIKQMVKLMGYHFKKHQVTTIIYCDLYINKTNKIRESQLFHLLLMSTILSLKFWEDYGVDSELVEEISLIPKKEMCRMEKDFLSVLDYSLYIPNTDIETLAANTILPAVSSTISVA